MGAFACWSEQKLKLHEELKESTDMAAVTYALRHTLAQVEQNTMAEQTDDLLRQQTGILFSCVKASAQLMDISVTTKVWVPSGHKEPKRGAGPWLWPVAALLGTVAGMYGYIKGFPLVWGSVAAALVVAGVALWQEKRRQKHIPQDEYRVTLRPDLEKLFGRVDGQMQSIDRYINDFAYLNEQSVSQEKAADEKFVGLMADMLEALYECDGEAREAAGEAAQRMMQGLDMEAVEYSPQNRKWFTTLPSKTETRTMVPAILAADDHRLLRRGVAAVCAEVPAGEVPAGEKPVAEAHVAEAAKEITA